MPRVRRTDLVRLDKATRTDEGYLVAPAAITKTGVFEYLTDTGATVRELRLPEEVFDPASLASFRLKPLTRGHPEGWVNAKSVRALAVGLIADPHKDEDGTHVAAEVHVQDADAVAAVEGGERQLSCGYTAELEPVPGGLYRHPDGREDRVDFIQRKIRGNHVALVARGRAGATAAIRLDAAGDEIQDHEETKMDPKELAALVARLDAAEKTLASEAKARTDAATASEKLAGENAALKARLDTAEKTLAEAAKAKQLETHRALCDRAAKLTGKSVAELVKLDAAAIHREVLAKEAPGLALEGRSDAFLESAFETVIATRSDAASAVAGAAAAALAASGGDAETRIDAARKAAIERSTNAWKNVKPTAS